MIQNLVVLGLALIAGAACCAGLLVLLNWSARRAVQPPEIKDLPRIRLSKAEHVAVFEGPFTGSEIEFTMQQIGRWYPRVKNAVFLENGCSLQFLDDKQMEAAGWRRITPSDRSQEKAVAVAEILAIAAVHEDEA